LGLIADFGRAQPVKCQSGLIDMLSLMPSIDQLSRIIAGVAAPAFLLGAVAAFISVLAARMNRVIERSRFLHGISDEARSHLKADIPRLKRRAILLNRATYYSIMCAVVTALLIILAFVSALLHLTHEYGVAVLFVIALSYFLLSLIDFARETRMALHDLDHLV
jgi:Protein of unknown function (DUF2721)